MRTPATLFGLAAAATLAAACDSCHGPTAEVQHVRNVRRMQPGASGAATGPIKHLEWGQLNFLHTTDTHGWLEGHLKEKNYGADWGDFVSFSYHMKHRAGKLGVDLLIVDTGDLHDGAGLSDAALPNGVLSNPIFDEIEYDVLTVGNHELYVSEIAYEHFYNFSKVWGDKYVTSNVQVYNPKTSAFEYMGSKYYYFETKQGLRIMSFGVLFDFTGNSNVSKIITAKTMVQQQWFLDAVNYSKGIDLFLVIGHNPIRTNVSSSTFKTVRDAIKMIKPNTPIQVFGGHSHIRDFQVYDDMSTGLESGRYCETLGWLSMSGIKTTNPKYKGKLRPHGVPNPTRKATANSTSGIVYSRRYLDWNRLTFAHHAKWSQDNLFHNNNGMRVTTLITAARKKLNLTSLYGCAPATYCQSCQPFGSPGNIFSLVSTALSAEVVNRTRCSVPRYLIANSGSIRFDLVKGPFTYDDSFIVSPFEDAFQYIPNVPYALAKDVLSSLNSAKLPSKRTDQSGSMPEADGCVDPTIGLISGTSHEHDLKSRGHVRRQTITTTPGYTTTDDFGTDGDDTAHSKIPYYPVPSYVAGNASFPTDGTNPAVVDVIFFDYFAPTVVTTLNSLGGVYTNADVQYYMDKQYTARDYLPAYAQHNWQANVPNCPVGQGVGYTV